MEVYENLCVLWPIMESMAAVDSMALRTGFADEWMSETEKREGYSKRVLAHNDVQNGNILRLTKPNEETFSQRQGGVVPFRNHLVYPNSVGNIDCTDRL